MAASFARRVRVSRSSGPSASLAVCAALDISDTAAAKRPWLGLGLGLGLGLELGLGIGFG